MGNPARFDNGLTNVSKNNPLKNFIDTDPTKAYRYFNDFHTYVAGDWTVTETQAGATQALSAGAAGGVLLLTNDTGNTDVNQLQLATESFKHVAGKQWWIKSRFALTADTMGNFGAVVGLAITDTSATAGVTDGIYFRKASGAATLEFVVEKDSTETASGTLATMVTATFVEVAAYYNGKDAIECWVNGVHTATITTLTNVPDDEELAVTLATVNATAGAANVLSVDYIFIAVER
jgi:hypothetical protein